MVKEAKVRKKVVQVLFCNEVRRTAEQNERKKRLMQSWMGLSQKMTRHFYHTILSRNSEPCSEE